MMKEESIQVECDGGGFRVLITEPLAAGPLEWLRGRCDVVECSSDDDAQFERELVRADGLIVRTYTNVDAGLLAKGPRLRVVGRAGVGIDNIDVEACEARGVKVVYTPDANGAAVVDYVFGHILDRYRPREGVSEALAIAEWQALRNSNVAGLELGELTLGILGFGRIGKRVALVGEGLGMRVLYHDLKEIPADERGSAVGVSFDELLGEADILTMHIDGRVGNRGLFDAARFSALKPGVLFVNSARGMVVDAGAAAAFFQEHGGGHADAFGVFDVHDPEPIVADYPLLGLENVKLTPHIAGRSVRGLLRMSEVVFDIWAVLNGEAPKYPAG